MENLNAQPDVDKPEAHIDKRIKIFILVFVLAGFISAFIGGYFISSLLSQEKNISYSDSVKPISPTPSPTNSPEIPEDSTKFEPGKHYYDDTVMIITKETPQKTLVATVNRNEKNGDYLQTTRTSFHDGSKWTRKSENKSTKNSTIVSGNLVKDWNLNIDPSRVLKQTFNGSMQIDNNSLTFSSEVLQNEISVRSLPGYTKFMSEGDGTFSINGTNYQAHILYTRIYSENASDIQFYEDPFGLTTDWIAFWDNQGNFYHIDSTFVDKPTEKYQTHQLGILKKSDGSVNKTFDVKVSRNEKDPPDSYTVTLGTPINNTIQFNRINAVNKAPNGSYAWLMGNIEGNTGVGLVEYIHH